MFILPLKLLDINQAIINSTLYLSFPNIRERLIWHMQLVWQEITRRKCSAAYVPNTLKFKTESF